MSTDHRCLNCDNPITAGQPRGLCPYCALEGALTVRAQEPVPDLPRAFGNYELVEEIARGGMGVVYKARQPSLNRLVAIKLLLLGPRADPDFVKRFRIEASAAAALQHPNIVAIHEVGVHQGEHFLAMDYVDGPTLSRLVREQPLPPKRAARYVKTIAEAIHYAHERGILHRDLKPSNVLLDSNDQPRVTDFGLAKRFQTEARGSTVETAQLTLSGQVVGSPGYMPPEQAAGSRGRISRRSDVYALGATLYHLLTGRPPFVGETLADTLEQVRHQEPIPPRLLNGSLPRDLETICLKCLEKVPERRYATARDLAEELGRFLDGAPILARPVSRPEKLWRWCRRNPPLSGAIAAAAGLFVLGFASTAWQLQHARERAEEAQLNLYIADMNLAYQGLRQDNRTYALDKLRRHLPQRGQGTDRRGWEWRYLWERCQPDELASFPGETPVIAVTVSRDGAWLATATEDGTVQIRDLAQRRTVTRFTAGPWTSGQAAIAFSPDSRSLAMVNEGRILIANTTTWQLDRTLTPARPARIFALLFSINGSNVLATSTTGLHAWDRVTAREVPAPIVFSQPCRQFALAPDGGWLALFTDDRMKAWNLSTAACVLDRRLGVQQVTVLAFATNGLLAAFERDGIVRVWHLPRLTSAADDSPHQAWSAHASTIFAADFSPDHSLLATGGSDQNIRVWSVGDWERQATLKGHGSEVWSLAFTPDGARLVSGGKEGAVKEWDPRHRALSEILPGTTLPLTFLTDQRTIATLTPDRTLQFWDVASRALQRTFRLATNLPVNFLELTPDGSTVVIRSGREVIHVVDAQTGESRGTLDLDPTGLRHAIPFLFLPDSRHVLVSTERDTATGRERAMELFRLDTRRQERVFGDLAPPVCLSGDGRLLAGRDSAGHAAVHEVATGRRLNAFNQTRSPLTSLAFSWNGKVLAVASSDHAIRLWDQHSGRLMSTLTGHQQGIGEMVFSRDNRTLFSSSTDDTVKLWNVATGQEMLSITDFGDDTHDLALSPDDTTLAVGGVDFRRRPVQLWRAPTLEAIDTRLHRAEGNGF